MAFNYFANQQPLLTKMAMLLFRKQCGNAQFAREGSFETVVCIGRMKNFKLGCNTIPFDGGSRQMTTESNCLCCQKCCISCGVVGQCHVCLVKPLLLNHGKLADCSVFDDTTRGDDDGNASW